MSIHEPEQRLAGQPHLILPPTQVSSTVLRHFRGSCARRQAPDGDFLNSAASLLPADLNKIRRLDGKGRATSADTSCAAHSRKGPAGTEA